jgi:hypothetical protein
MSVTFQTLVTNRKYQEMVDKARIDALAKGLDPNGFDLAEESEFQDGSINVSNSNARNLMQTLGLDSTQYSQEAFASWSATEVLHKASKWLSGPRIEDQGYEVMAMVSCWVYSRKGTKAV